jgi:four helix bundle protein
MVSGEMMATFEDLQVLKAAEAIADSIWKKVVEWNEFAKDVIGKQITRSADSIGANIAESVGRYNFGEKLQFLYYARGSLFETKYWLNRIKERGLMNVGDVQNYVNDLTALARQLNSFASGLKTVRADQKKTAMREDAPEYITDSTEVLFSETDIALLSN